MIDTESIVFDHRFQREMFEAVINALNRTVRQDACGFCGLHDCRCEMFDDGDYGIWREE